MGLLGNLFGSKKAAEKKADSFKTDMSKFYPYIITEAYVAQGAIIINSLGHGLFTSLVYDMEELVGNVTPQQLAETGLKTEEVFEQALSNMDAVLRTGQIKIAKFNGPAGLPLILVSDHWLSAAAMLERNIFSWAQTNLGTTEIYASVPHRDVLLLFPKCEGKELDDFKQMIVEKESDGAKPLTFGIFQLDGGGTPKPIE